MQAILISLLLAVSAVAVAQSSEPAHTPWQMQQSGTTASLRGIFSVDGTVAWASGTGGTVLKTIDGGAHWTACAIPDAAADGATLDFRGMQAWDVTTAIVMASGPGDKSRLYKTTDGCKTWTLDSKNTEKDGFWDTVVFQHGDFGYAIGDSHTGVLVGDPVNGRFETKVMILGHGWFIDDAGCSAPAEQAAFAASNSSIFVFGSRKYILGAGGKVGASVYISPLLLTGRGTDPCLRIPVPISGGNESSGVFSIAFRDLKHGIVVGGDYTKPNESNNTAAHTEGDWKRWTASTTPPHGFRSAVQWDEALKAWITVGTNGSDISRDDGKTWQPLDNGNWNALSLPFVVGPDGRIARLNPAALPHSMP
jgi:photosystem II stability/assembly factor-like uncharacterized protein